MIRRTIGFILTVVLTLTAGYQLAWHKDLRDRIWDHPFQSIGLLVLAFAAIGVILWSTVRPHHGSAFFGVAFGAGAVLLGSHLFHGIKWTTLGLLGLVLLGLMFLWALTVRDRVPGGTRLSSTARSAMGRSGSSSSVTSPISTTATTVS